MSLKVIKSGFLATVQDYGRLTHGEHGMGQSGVMDEHAYVWANYLLGNDFNAAVVEITFGNFALQVKSNTFIVVTGADLNFKINTKPAQMWRSLRVLKGDTLTWDKPRSGIRAYLAVKGGVNTKILFDSRSVNLREQIGGKLCKGDQLPCRSFSKIINRPMLAKYIPNYTHPLILRMLPSYQFSEFSPEQRDLFFNQSYVISSASDRTGCRLNGRPIALKKSMISEGASYGSVEITSDGLPIILLKDAPTIGGYPKIGTVFSLDLAKLAQRQAHAQLRFGLISISQAQQARRVFNAFFKIGA